MRARVLGIAAALCAAVGCANVLGIPSSDSLSFCAQPQNQGHDDCQDFDIGDPSTQWTAQAQAGGATWSLQPFTNCSGCSRPNVLDLNAPAPGTIAAFNVQIPNKPFGALHVEADLRFVGDATGQLSGGFMVISDAFKAGCIALGATTMPMQGSPAGIYAFALPAKACANIANPGGGGMGGLGTPLPIGPAPVANLWYHMRLDILPNADGTAQIALDLGLPSGLVACVPAGTLTPGGTPSVGFAAEPQASNGFEVQIDNVTVDVDPPDAGSGSACEPGMGGDAGSDAAPDAAADAPTESGAKDAAGGG
jgi:hypothetical protein